MQIKVQVLCEIVASTTFKPVIPKPEYAIGKDPVVAIDEDHNNFHIPDKQQLG